MSIVFLGRPARKRIDFCWKRKVASSPISGRLWMLMVSKPWIWVWSAHVSFTSSPPRHERSLGALNP